MIYTNIGGGRQSYFLILQGYSGKRTEKQILQAPTGFTLVGTLEGTSLTARPQTKPRDGLVN